MKAGAALGNGSSEAFSALVDRVSRSEITANVTQSINASAGSADAFFSMVSAKLNAGKLMGGAVLTGVGGAMLAESVGVAAALGISIVSAKVVAIILLLYGLSIALPAIWDTAKDRLGNFDLGL